MYQPGQKCIVQNVNTIDLEGVNGSIATVQSFLKQRGEPPIYYCTIENYYGVFSLYDNELKPIEPVTRWRSKMDVSDLA